MNPIAIWPQGVLLPESVLYSEWFGIFASFVALNTLVYVLLGLTKLFPVLNLRKFRRTQIERSETRSIYPEETPEITDAAQ